MVQIYEFGTAPQAKLAGYDILVETVVSSDIQLQRNHFDEDAVFVRGPAIQGRPGFFEFARFENKAARIAAQALYMEYMERRVPCVIYPDAQSLAFILAPAERPTLVLGRYYRVETARRFCETNSLALTEHKTCPDTASVDVDRNVASQTMQATRRRP